MNDPSFMAVKLSKRFLHSISLDLLPQWNTSSKVIFNIIYLLIVMIVCFCCCCCCFSDPEKRSRWSILRRNKKMVKTNFLLFPPFSTSFSFLPSFLPSFLLPSSFPCFFFSFFLPFYEQQWTQTTIPLTFPITSLLLDYLKVKESFVSLKVQHRWKSDKNICLF